MQTKLEEVDALRLEVKLHRFERAADVARRAQADYQAEIDAAAKKYEFDPAIDRVELPGGAIARAPR